MTFRRGIAVALAVVAGVVAYLWWPSEERRVRTRVEALADAVSVPPKEADLARLARAQRFRGWLLDDARVEFEQAEWPPVVGRDAIAALVARPWSQAAGGLKVELQDLTIAIGEDRASADARFTARIVSLDPSGEPATVDGRMVSVTFRRVGGEWLVATARVLRSDEAVR